MTDYTAKWGALISKTVDEQTKFFLHAFVLDFQGKFEQVCTQISFSRLLDNHSTRCSISQRNSKTMLLLATVLLLRN